MERQKVYFAVLNKGWLRRELVWSVLPAMIETPGVELVMENPSHTVGHPIMSNRNAIAKRFLQTDCEWLLMLDDDVIPLNNPCEMVYADKDVIGMPAKVRQPGRILNWVVYMKTQDGTRGYMPVDLEHQDPHADLLKCDIIGTGCILIRRKVIEAIKAPFNDIFTEDGIRLYGTDFAFCQRATEAGFEVWACRNRWCEHIKDGFGLLDMSGYDDVDKALGDNMPYQIPWGGDAIASKDWEFIREVVAQYKPAAILEFGAGLSSLLMSTLAPVESYETDPVYGQKILDKRGPLNRLQVLPWDGQDCTPLQSHYDLAFVDGPRGQCNGGPGREHSMRLVAEYAERVIVHDAGRPEEQVLQRKYLRDDGFALLRWSACHQGRCQLWVRDKE